MSASKAKGTRWESAIVEFLRGRGFPYAERRALAGTRDLGDVTGIPGVVIEAKNEKQHNLTGWLKEAEQERRNADADLGVVWFKRRGKTSAGDGFVLMDGDTFAYLLRQSGYGAERPIEHIRGQLDLEGGAA
jgi:hypothetical protein